MTNHAYLRGRLHRAMRASLERSFPRIEVLDLHGSVRVRQAGAGRDGNVFGIGQGVCIAHMVRGLPPADGGVHFAELRGRDPEELYDRLCAQRGEHIDRCVLYVFRTAVYYAGRSRHDPELLKWWNWKDRQI